MALHHRLTGPAASAATLHRIAEYRAGATGTGAW